MPFNPKDMPGMGTQGQAFEDAVKKQISEDLENASDVQLGLAEQIFVASDPGDLYNKNDIFDRDRIINLGSINIEKVELESLSDLLDARVFEHKLDRATVQLVYEAANLDKLPPELDKLSSEISLARNRLATAKTFYQIVKSAERSFIDPERKLRLRQYFTEMTRARKENPFVKRSEEHMYNPYKVLCSMYKYREQELGYYSPTWLFVQAIEDLKAYYYEGGSANIFLPPATLSKKRDLHEKQINDTLDKLYDYYNDPIGTGRKAAYQIGLPKMNTQSNFVMNDSATKYKVPIKTSDLLIKRVAQLCSIVANEFRLSAGLGRVREDKLAKKYGLNPNTKLPFHNMLGGSNVHFVSKTNKTKGSLQDLAVVSKSGKLTESATDIKVKLFDAYQVPQLFSGTGENAKTAFIDTVRANPSNNNLDDFDKIMQRAQVVLDEIGGLIEMTNCEDLDVNLMTPQGLFVRVLEEFCKMTVYLAYEGDEVARMKQVAMMHFLQRTKAKEGTKSGWDGIIKMYMLTFCARLLQRRREASGVTVDQQPRLSSLEASKKFKANLESDWADRNSLAQALIATTYTLNFNPAFSGVNEHLIIDNPQAHVQAWSMPQYSDYYDQKMYNKAEVISGQSMLDINDDAEGSEGLLKGIVDIYEELEKEAMQASGEGSFITMNRITNANGFDAALLMNCILECFCLLAQGFSKTKLYIGQRNSSHNEGYVASSILDQEENDTWGDLSNRGYYDYISSLRTTRDTTNAFAITRGEANNEFAEAFATTATGNMLSNLYSDSVQLTDDIAKAAEVGQETQGAEFAGYVGEHINETYHNELAVAGIYGSVVQRAKAVSKFNSNEAFLQHFSNKLRNRAGDQFAAADHVMLYQSGRGALQRQTLLEILAAAKDGDLSALFDTDDPDHYVGGNFTANEGHIPYHESLALYDDHFSAQQVIHMINELSISHVAPTRTLDFARAMFKHLNDSTLELSRAAAALRAEDASSIEHRGVKISDVDDQTKAYVDLANSETGRKLLRGFSKRQLEIIESRFKALEVADENQGYMIEFLSNPMVQALKIYLEYLKGEKRTGGKFVFYGLPAGKLEEMMYNRDVNKINEEGYDSSTFESFFDSSLDDAVIEFKVKAINELEPALKHKSPSYRFPLNISIDEEGVDFAFRADAETKPTNWSGFWRFCQFKIDSPLTDDVSVFTGKDIVNKYGSELLKNTLESFLIKKMAEVVFRLDLSEKEMVKSSPLPQSAGTYAGQRTSNAKELMKSLVATFTGPSKVLPGVNTLFNNKGDLKEPTASTSNATMKDAKIQKEHIDLMVSLFNTKPFFADSIEEYISRPSVFDYVFAIFVEHHDVGVDHLASSFTPAGNLALAAQKFYGENFVFSLKTVHTEVEVKKRKSGELL